MLIFELGIALAGVVILNFISLLFLSSNLFNTINEVNNIL